MNIYDGLRIHAQRILDGIEEAREKNASQGWYNFVSLHDTELLAKYAMHVLEQRDDEPPAPPLV